MTAPPSVHTIIHEVAAETGVPKSAILGRAKNYKTASARRLAMIRVRNEITIAGRPASFPLIGKWFDRDHTTVIHACRDDECTKGRVG